MRITFTLNGEGMHLGREEVIGKLNKVEPEAVQTHAVKIGDRLFPMKQAFAGVTGLDRLDFTTNQARTQFKRMVLK